jgi:hypothetical protein
MLKLGLLVAVGLLACTNTNPCDGTGDPLWCPHVQKCCPTGFPYDCNGECYQTPSACGTSYDVCSDPTKKGSTSTTTGSTGATTGTTGATTGTTGATTGTTGATNGGSGGVTTCGVCPGQLECSTVVANCVVRSCGCFYTINGSDGSSEWYLANGQCFMCAQNGINTGDCTAAANAAAQAIINCQ